MAGAARTRFINRHCEARKGCGNLNLIFWITDNRERITVKGNADAFWICSRFDELYKSGEGGALPSLISIIYSLLSNTFGCRQRPPSIVLRFPFSVIPKNNSAAAHRDDSAVVPPRFSVLLRSLELTDSNKLFVLNADRRAAISCSGLTGAFLRASTQTALSIRRPLWQLPQGYFS